MSCVSLMTPLSSGVGNTHVSKAICNESFATSYKSLYETKNQADMCLNHKCSVAGVFPAAFAMDMDEILRRSVVAYYYSGEILTWRHGNNLLNAQSIHRYFSTQEIIISSGLLKNCFKLAQSASVENEAALKKLTSVRPLTLERVCTELISVFDVTRHPISRTSKYARTINENPQPIADQPKNPMTPFAYAVARMVLNIESSRQLLCLILNKLGRFPYGSDTVTISFGCRGLSPEQTLWCWAALINDDPHCTAVRLLLQVTCNIVQHHAIDILWENLPLTSEHISPIRIKDERPFLVDMLTGDMDSDSNIVLHTPEAPPAANNTGSVGVATDIADNTAIETGTEDVHAEVVEEEAQLEEVADTIEDIVADVPVLEHRLGKVINTTMRTTNIPGDILLNITMPQTALRALDSTPQALLFKQEAYVMLSMSIRVLSNCSKFQQGAALVAFLYAQSQRDFPSELLNLRTLYTAPRAMLNGSFATSVEMDVPFEHVQPVIATAQNEWTTSLDVGNLVVACIDPVAVATGSSQAINYVVYVKFKMCKLFGKRGFYTPWVPIPCVAPAQGDSAWERDLTRENVESNPGPAVTTMLTIAMKKAVFTHIAKPIVGRLKDVAHNAVDACESKLLGSLGEDADRDKPSMLTNEPMFLTTMHPLSSGVGKFHVKTHRLDPGGTTVHPKDYVGVDRKFNYGRIKTMYGLQEIFNWPDTAVVNTRLWSTHVQPGTYPQTIFGGTLTDTFTRTPVDFLADNYECYRGSLRYKFTIVATGMHTGKLRVTYEPEVQQTSACDVQGVKFEVLELGADLDGNVSYGFDVPYQSLLLMHPITSANSTSVGGIRMLSGVLSVFVENPLVAPATVSNRVRVIVEKRGYDNLENGVPGPVKTRFTTTAFATFTTRIGLTFTASASNVANIVVRRADTNAIVGTFIKPLPGFAALFSINSATFPIKWDTQNITQSLRQVYIYTDEPDRVIFQIQPNTVAVNRRRGFQAAADIDYGYTFTEAGFWNGNILSPITVTATYPPVPAFREGMRGDMDSRYEEPSHITASKKSAMITPIQTGEDHMKIKTLLRRFEPWYDFVTYPLEHHSPYLANISLPCSFGAPINRNIAEEYMKANRVTSFHDVFRFSRGSVRFVLACYATKGDIRNVLMQTTHIPFDKPNVIQEEQFGTIASCAMGYATEIHSLDKNPIVSVEIPNYLLGRKIYNSAYVSTELLTQMMNSLGNLKVTFYGPISTEIRCIVYRAIGDDLLMSIFNGLPQRIASPLSLSPYLGNSRPVPVAPTGWVRDLTEEGVEPNPGPFEDSTFSILGSAFSGAMHSVNRNADKMGSLAEAIEMVVRRDERLLKYVDILLQVAHVLVNPTLSTFAIAMTSIILKIIPAALMSKLGSGVSNLVNRLFRTSDMTGDMDAEPHSMAESVWDCLGEFFNVRPSMRSSWMRKFGVLMRLSTMADKILAFVESVLFGMKVFLNKVYQLYDKDGYLFKIIADSEIIKCVIGYNNLVTQLTDQAVFRQLTASQVNISFCFTTRNYGRIMAANLVQTRKLSPTLHQSVSRSLNDMDKLCTRLLAYADRPLTRREPFCVYMYGDAGVGKSNLAHKFMLSLLQSVDIPITCDPIFAKSSGTTYMDGYKTQPGFLYDDFAAVTDNEATEFAELIALKSSNYYQGNFSEITDKQLPVHPTVLFLCSNNPMPEHPMIQTPSAIFRRRDILVKAQFSPNFKKCAACNVTPTGLGCDACVTINQDLIDAGKHLRFLICDRMTGEATQTVYTGVEAFEKHLRDQHAIFYAKESKRVAERVLALNNAIEATQHTKTHVLCADKSYTKEKLVEVLNSTTLDLHIDQNFVDTFNMLLQTNNSALINSKVLTNDEYKFFTSKFEEAGDMEAGTTGDGWVNYAAALAGSAISLTGLAAAHTSYTWYKRLTTDKPESNCIHTMLDALKSGERLINIAPALLVKRAQLNQNLEDDILQVLGEVESNEAKQIRHLLAAHRFMLTPPDTEKPGHVFDLNNQNIADYVPDTTSVAEISFSNGFYYVGDVRYLAGCDDCMSTFDKDLLAHKYDLDLEGTCLCNNEAWRTKTAKDVYQSGRYVYIRQQHTWNGFNLFCDSCKQDPMNMHLRSSYNFKHGYGLPNTNQEQCIVDLGKSIAFAIGVCSVMVYAFKILRSLYLLIFPSRGDAGGADADYERERQRALAKMRNEKKQNKSARRYMRHTGDADFDVGIVYNRSLCVLKSGPSSTKGVGIAGTNILTTGHWYETFKSEGKCTHNGIEFTFEEVECKQLSMEHEGRMRTADVVMLKFPNRIPAMRNIVHHFASEDELERQTIPKRIQYEDSRSTKTILGLPIEEVVISTYYDGAERFVAGWEYDFANVGVDYALYNGGCMSALIDNVHKKIIGFHVASGPRKILQRYGFAQCITRETLNSLLGIDAVKESEVVDLNFLYSDEFTTTDNVEPLLALKPYISCQATLTEPIRHVTYSDFKPSPMFGIITEDGKKPVIFKTIGEAFPGVAKMETALNKNEPIVGFKQAHITKAKAALKSKILSYEPTYNVHQSRTTTESIQGVLGMEFMRPQVGTTANGIPVRCMFPAKKDTYKTTGKGLFLNTLIVDLHERNMAMRFDGQCPPTAFQVVLKDELKSDGKRDSPREIDCSPTEFTQAVRRYTLDFSAAFYENNLKQFSAVGMNCLGSDWERLCMKLRWHDYIIAGDVSAFGPTLPHEICENVWSAINHWYDNKADKRSEQANKVRNVLCKESLTSVKVAYNTVFKTQCSSPSGLGITTIVNTCSMWQYLYIAWMTIVEELYARKEKIGEYSKTDALSVASFEEHVDTIIYGDDLICSVSPVVRDVFNNLTIAEVFKNVGIKYTDGAKSQVTEPFVKLSDATFLGRAFTKLEGHNVGALNKGLIENIVNWTKCRNPNNVMHHMLSSTQSACIEMMFHGKAAHNATFKKFLKFWQSEGRNEDLVGYSYAELYDRWIEDKLRDEEKLTFDCMEACSMRNEHEEN